MSKSTKNPDIKGIQFKVQKGNTDYEVLEFIEGKFPNKKRSDSVRDALKNLKIIFDVAGDKNIEDIIKIVATEGDHDNDT